MSFPLKEKTSIIRCAPTDEDILIVMAGLNGFGYVDKR
jgi:hypothetical protein